MKQDEFAFFNQQLAAMLREGIPLEGALKRLCAGMKTGQLRTEFEQLEAELARGTPVSEAIARRKLPELYKRLVQVGVQGNDLPGVLTLVADHYQRANALWSRLKGLMVYPALVICIALGLTVLVSYTMDRFLSEFFAVGSITAPPINRALQLSTWVTPILLLMLGIALAAAWWVPWWRARLRWSLPAFREATLAQLASSLALMVRNGAPLPDALALAQALEPAAPAARSLGRWRQFMAEGAGRPAQWPETLHPLVGSSRVDLQACKLEYSIVSPK